MMEKFGTATEAVDAHWHTDFNIIISVRVTVYFEK
jgi:hypothetical protein